MHIGWDGVRRIHGCLIHIDIIKDKIWVQYDGTSTAIAEELLEMGVPREDIVLGFHPLKLRQYTDFAVSQFFADFLQKLRTKGLAVKYRTKTEGFAQPSIISRRLSRAETHTILEDTTSSID
jgi:XisI protein